MVGKLLRVADRRFKRLLASDGDVRGEVGPGIIDWKKKSKQNGGGRG